MDWPSLEDAPLADALLRVKTLEAQLAQAQQEASEANAAIAGYRQDADDAKAAAAEAYQSMEQAFSANEASAARARLLEQEVLRLKGTPSPAQSLASSDLGGSATSSQHAGNAFATHGANGGNQETVSHPPTLHNPWGRKNVSTDDNNNTGK